MTNGSNCFMTETEFPFIFGGLLDNTKFNAMDISPINGYVSIGGATKDPTFINVAVMAPSLFTFKPSGTI